MMVEDLLTDDLDNPRKTTGEEQPKMSSDDFVVARKGGGLLHAAVEFDRRFD